MDHHAHAMLNKPVRICFPCVPIMFPFAPLLQEHELVRIWDSMEWEDELEDDLSVGIRADGALDPTQTRQVLHLACNIMNTCFLTQKTCLVYIYLTHSI